MASSKATVTQKDRIQMEFKGAVGAKQAARLPRDPDSDISVIIDWNSD